MPPYEIDVGERLMERRSFIQYLGSLSDAILDPSVVFSFDQTGFLRHRLQFESEDMNVDMSGRTCVVTGANSGLGFATAMGLAQRGATVWLVCRSAEKGERAADQIRHTSGNGRVFCAQVDVSDFQSIDQFHASAEIESIDVWINNAGVLLSERAANVQGFEMTLATNLLGPLRLTSLFLDRLRTGSRSRIIWVSSGGMYAKRLDVDSLFSPPDPFDGVAAYAQTKRALVVINELIAERLRGRIASHCMHPGWANTPGVEHSIPNFWKLTRPILRNPESGSDTILWLSVCDKAQTDSGRFWFDRRARRTHFLRNTEASEQDRHSFWEKVHAWAEVNPSVWGE